MQEKNAGLLTWIEKIQQSSNVHPPWATINTKELLFSAYFCGNVIIAIYSTSLSFPASWCQRKMILIASSPISEAGNSGKRTLRGYVCTTVLTDALTRGTDNGQAILRGGIVCPAGLTMTRCNQISSFFCRALAWKSRCVNFFFGKKHQPTTKLPVLCRLGYMILSIGIQALVANLQL